MKYSVLALSFFFVHTPLFSMGGCGGGVFEKAEKLEKLAEAAKKNGNEEKQKALLRMAEIERNAAINGHETVDWEEYKKLQKQFLPDKEKTSSAHKTH